ncbi:hypothetical protein JTB14_000301 [Gonioctena quinquepunctata]|nr:hypothetical protein JTB14_000301 [Gonioctena quinquepunctata]KAG5868252.1 hypothetical protein JTB14_000301 [Gonioctena quinquepunctata]
MISESTSRTGDIMFKRSVTGLIVIIILLDFINTEGLIIVHIIEYFCKERKNDLKLHIQFHGNLHDGYEKNLEVSGGFDELKSRFWIETVFSTKYGDQVNFLSEGSTWVRDDVFIVSKNGGKNRMPTLSAILDYNIDCIL